MATPYEFIAHQLQRQLPNAAVSPFPEGDGYTRADVAQRLYRSGAGNDFPPDYTKMSMSYPGGYPFYYPLLLTRPHQRPLVLRVANGAEALAAFTRPESAARALLAHYGYWRIEAAVSPATADFWVLRLPRRDDFPLHLILPSARLRQLLDRAHNPEKFSLFLTKSGQAFAAQPLPAADRLALLRDPARLAADAYRDLDMRAFLDNWQQLALP